MTAPMMPNEKPRLHIPVEKLKEAKNWKVGSKYVLELEVEMVGLNKEVYGEGEICADFLVKKAKPLGEKSALSELSKRYEN